MIKKLCSIGSITAVVAALSSFSAAALADRVYLDVRTPQEFQQGHLEGAINIPFDQIGERAAAAGLKQDDELVVYCRSGRRAGMAIKTLESMGYSNMTNVRDLDGARGWQVAHPQ
ncbi:rhodanese-like domain-containing protein [Oceanobacter mangrovi]|uniref:rhodanese-like domain-containing protein n=1 Tax=Oceanobacter mangrovi TaxID=2862510 RepID=UPI001C8EDA50|nr:rhodanese-like domain-containing protein [Oceanobacter mangrovi]